MNNLQFTVNGGAIQNYITNFGLKPNAIYSVNVQAIYKNGQLSNPSNTITVVNGPTPPPPPPSPNFINGYFTSPSQGSNSFSQLLTVTGPSTVTNNTSLTDWLTNSQCNGSDTSYVLYICNGNITDIGSTQLNPLLPLGVTQYVGFLGSSSGSTAYLSINQTLNFATTGSFTLSFLIAPSNPSSASATYNPNNNIININVNNGVLNETIILDPNNWNWIPKIYTINIPVIGNYIFTFTQNITGTYSPSVPASLFFVTGFNLALQTMIQNTTEQYTQVGGTVYGIDDYTIVVFEYTASGTQSITFNQAINNMSMLVVGGGGGGGQNNGALQSNGGGGGGGGGIYYLENDTAMLTTYDIKVGNGSSVSTNGNPSIVTFNTFTVSANGGGGTPLSSKGLGGTASSNYTKGTAYNGGAGSSGNYKTAMDISESSNIPNSSLNITPSILLHLSGGGGGAVQTSIYSGQIPAGPAGTAGLGIGGITGGGGQAGGDGIYIFRNGGGFGGGGGGSAGNGNPNAPTGSGGNGVVIFWWPNQ